MSDDKAKNHAKAAQKQKQSAAQKAKLIAAKNKKKSIDEKIETLEGAHRKLEVLLGELSAFRTNLQHQLHINASDFKGNQADNYDQLIQDSVRAISKIEGKHEQNKYQIARKINELRHESASLGKTMAAISATINSLMSEVSSLLN
ncbi:hypothetical protein [Latilactobacillus fragifolii]|uniref:hypothetical protein n=1 Tax=Latilactobacillus fragifolii TaxID=2814244 RepID=UPI001ABA0F3A|nr:hypothetical protein [Latilactobacillus fragifolii]